MDDPSRGADDTPSGPPPWPQRQVYYVTIEWQDTPHQPESTERLAQAIRQAIELGHSPAAGTPPARFVVRVKANEVATELEGAVQHRHHHHHGPESS